jgi:hypothetical protein
MLIGSRAAAAALTLALTTASIALADGAADNQAFVEGKVKPAKLDKKTFKRVSLFTGVRTAADVTGFQANPKSELISFGKNIKLNLAKAPRCTAALPNGATPQQARAMCPAKSYLGSGHATLQFPGLLVSDIVVSVFNGPGKGQLRLHTYSQTLGAAAPTVNGKIVRSNAGRKYGQALSVPNAPETGSGMLTEFNANITRSSGVVTANCKARQFLFERRVTYTDGSKDTVTLKQPCTRKKRR